jgi:integrase
MTVEYLLHKELEHVLAALTPSNRLVARAMLHTGLRVGDVVSLRTDQLGLQFSVTEAKTGKRRKVGLPADLLAQIRAQAGPVWAFPGRKPGEHRTRQALWADMKRAARAFRLPQNVGTHSLRKVYAVDLLRKYGDIQRVQRALKHSSCEVTYLYALADKLLEAKQAERRRRGRNVNSELTNVSTL